MDWLNLHTSMLDSEAVVGAEPVDRATWLFLLRYCAGQENNGVIVGARAWGDRRWQQVCRVTLAEVQRDAALWTWHGDDLVVAMYPSEKEAEVRAKRVGGLAGARARWDGSANGSPIQIPDGEGRNSNWKEKEAGTGSDACPPPLVMEGRATAIDTAKLLAEFGLPSAKWHATEWRGGLNKVARCRSLPEAQAFLRWAMSVASKQGIEIEYFRHVRALAVEWDMTKRAEIWETA